jgi:hypothetical protein
MHIEEPSDDTSRVVPGTVRIGPATLLRRKQWGPFAPMAPPPVAEKARGPNPLFTVLAVLSAIPTAFFGLVYITGSQSNIAGLLLIWSFM